MSRKENIKWVEDSIRRVGLQPYNEGRVSFPYAVKLAMTLGVTRMTAEDYVKRVQASGAFETNGYDFLIPSSSSSSSPSSSSPQKNIALKPQRPQQTVTSDDTQPASSIPASSTSPSSAPTIALNELIDALEKVLVQLKAIRSSK